MVELPLENIKHVSNEWFSFKNTIKKFQCNLKGRPNTNNIYLFKKNKIYHKFVKI